MKAFFTATAVATTATTLASLASAQVPGFDISGWQESTDFEAAYADGNRFVYIKATEGTTYTSDKFSSQYAGATEAGLIRGAYHFAQPAASTGAEQAQFFVENGGGWSNDGITLPGALDIEYNPNGDSCYGMSAADLVSWIEDFVTTYESLTGRWPTIYTAWNWWNPCTGNSEAFNDRSPLWVAAYSDSVGQLPGGWPTHTIWQYNAEFPQGGDSNLFNGDESRLKALATGEE